ncbi:hypothetical protein DOM22_08745 [Bdellovibrio sp. ZAP7]|uniref:hypothetical protein n=1 Tax=Bdellovibrio sp. ZAP7 TaxID=2231053 RepID=UPI00115BBD1E|nr:hypothetical protein [Bdellovibrio sp. ZAP7]QDK45236.1 hypothetical protein DOM22_08745 [Bdellovibrio sp. ZAP7]
MKKFILSLIYITLIPFAAWTNTVRIGSGGDSQQSEHVPEDLLVDTLRNIQRDAQFLIHSWMWNPANSPLTPELLEKLRQVVINTPINVIGHDACYANGESKDAAAYSTPSNSICVSTWTLKTKLQLDNFKSQVLSLMIHEYSHLIGFNEEQATTLQQQSGFYLAVNGYAKPGSLQTDFGGIAGRADMFRRLSKNKKELYSFVNDYITEYQAKLTTYDGILLTNYPALPPLSDYTGDIFIRLNYMKILADGYRAARADKMAQDQLTRIFGPSKEVTVQAFNDKMFLRIVKNLQRPQDLLPRIDVKNASGEDFAKLVAAIEEMDQKIQMALLNIYAGRNLVRMELTKP